MNSYLKLQPERKFPEIPILMGSVTHHHRRLRLHLHLQNFAHSSDPPLNTFSCWVLQAYPERWSSMIQYQNECKK